MVAATMQHLPQQQLPTLIRQASSSYSTELHIPGFHHNHKSATIDSRKGSNQQEKKKGKKRNRETLLRRRKRGGVQVV
ncbi:putative parafibromin [Sesbania bispinosa]|nr:putative parafibromin [Sesbania bispinosa]